MNETEGTFSEISDDWLLASMPFISFCCENDALYSMRLLTGPGNGAFGYQYSEFVDNKNYFAASTTFPEDQDIVDSHAEQALAGGRPVVSRYRFVTADGEAVPVLLASQTVLGADGEVLGLSGCAFDLRLCPALQGEPAVLSSLRVPAVLRVPAKPTTNYTAEWVSNHLSVDTFICENDESYSVRVNRGAMEETLGYSTEDFRKAGPIKPWSVLHPDDQDVSDAYFEAAASREGTITVARIRLVAKSTEAVPVLVFARGIKLPDTDEIAISGGVLNITHVPGLQGPSKLLSTQTPV